MSFCRPPPPNFRGLDLRRKIEIYHRHLPHWRQAGATYFVTFRLKDSLPQSKVRELRELREAWERLHPEPRSSEDWLEYARKHTRLAERRLDEGHGKCWFKQARFSNEVAQAMQHFQGKRYCLSSFAVMPNHIHATVRPSRDHSLEKIIGSWKGFTAKRINSALGLTGSLWEQEGYDQIIRDAEHLYRVIQYIGNNPRKAGLPESQWVRWVHPEWERAGWGFDSD